MTATTKSPGRYLEPANRGGRYYDLVKVYDERGQFTEAPARGGRRYNLVKVYRTGRVLGS